MDLQYNCEAELKIEMNKADRRREKNYWTQARPLRLPTWTFGSSFWKIVVLSLVRDYEITRLLRTFISPSCQLYFISVYTYFFLNVLY